MAKAGSRPQVGGKGTMRSMVVLYSFAAWIGLSIPVSLVLGAALKGRRPTTIDLRSSRHPVLLAR